MLKKKFGRQYEIRIGRVVAQDKQQWYENYLDETFLLKAEKIANNESADLEYSLKLGSGETASVFDASVKGFILTENQIKCEISQSFISGTSTSSLTVVNLPVEVINWLDTSGAIYFINISAGYSSENTLPLLFVGEISSQATTMDNKTGEYLTTFTLQDSLSQTRYADISATLLGRDGRKGPTKKEVLDYLIKGWNAIGIPVAHADTEDDRIFIEKDQLVGQSWATSGDLNKAMNDFFDVYLWEYSWVIFAGRLYIWKSKGYFPVDDFYYEWGLGVNKISAYFIEDKDIIGTVGKGEYTKFKPTAPLKLQKQQAEPTKVITIKTLLDGRVIPSSILSAPNMFGERGYYLVDSVKHVLDFRGASWYTEIVAQPLGISV